MKALGTWPLVAFGTRARQIVQGAALIAMLTINSQSAPADEGMWLFTDPPREHLQQRYGFTPTDQWLSHLQESAVRFNSGGSGSFVSADGLVMTNHHVGADALQKLGTAERDLLAEGYIAKSREDELSCVDLELNVLKSIEDVTQRVNSAVKAEMNAADAQAARRAVMNTIEQESQEETGLRSDVITLYQGGRYHLYRYKKYTDVRLVFAPEQDIAFFGGDPDNFEYPRFCLDVCFFRAYEDGKPAKVDHYLTWSSAGADEGELIFVAGHPGRTNRQNTVAHLEFLRDVGYPTSLNMIRRREVLLSTYSERDAENARRARDELFGYQNSRKARLGGLAGLQDPELLQAKQEEEDKLRTAVASNEKFKETRDAWDAINAALDTYRSIYQPFLLYEQGSAFNSDLFGDAFTIVRLVKESERPNSDRLREFRESNLESVKQELFSEAPVYEDLEIIKLTDSLGMLMEQLGGNDPLVQNILAGKSPRKRAIELVQGSTLKEVSERQKLVEGGWTAIKQSKDPMIQLALLVDGPARDLRMQYEQKVEEPLRQAYASIAEARFELYGTSVYPDATFSLRLAFGTVTGYQELGTQVPPWTVIGGTYERAESRNHQPPYQLPPNWTKRKDQLDLKTPFNFVCTADIIGGNSGSPVVNQAGEIVGIIFDGNIYSLVLDFAYTSNQARAVSVHSAGILQALSSIYEADDLIQELTQN